MMKSKHVFYTRKLADLYLEQGYLDDAEMAFRELSGKEPDCDAYRSALNRISRLKKKRDLVAQVRIWADLLRREHKKNQTSGNPS